MYLCCLSIAMLPYFLEYTFTHFSPIGFGLLCRRLLLPFIFVIAFIINGSVGAAVCWCLRPSIIFFQSQAESVTDRMCWACWERKGGKNRRQERKKTIFERWKEISSHSIISGKNFFRWYSKSRVWERKNKPNQRLKEKKKDIKLNTMSTLAAFANLDVDKLVKYFLRSNLTILN